MDHLDYDQLAREYNASLTDKLRGHGVQGTFLEHWVPDEDPARGILNMIEAAETDHLDRVAIYISARTIDESGIDRLRKMVEGLAAINAAAQGAGFVIEAYDIGRQKVSARRRDDPSSSPATVASIRYAASDELRQSVGIHPSLAAKLITLSRAITHEGMAEASPGSTRHIFEQDGATVSIDVLDDGRVAQARHRSIASADRRMVVDLMCRLIEGRTVQDASDHAGVLAIDALRPAGQPVPGVLLVANAGTEIAAALRLIRGACRPYLTGHSTGTANFFEKPPSAEWLATAPATRLSRIEVAIASFVSERKWLVDTIRTLSLDQDLLGYPVRVLIELDDILPTHAKPSVLRDLERWLKRFVEPKLQVHLAPLKDKNSIRRL